MQPTINFENKQRGKKLYVESKPVSKYVISQNIISWDYDAYIYNSKYAEKKNSNNYI